MDPLALLPYALAAAGGRVGAHDAAALVAAGVTLLQRSAPLVRALAGRRSALWLPTGPAWFVALGASDGRGALLLDAEADHPPFATDLQAAAVGAVFTTRALADRLPPDLPRVLLDEAPRRAVVSLGTRRVEVDLGSHFGLQLAGDTSVPGSPEECLGFGPRPFLSHAQLLGAARALLARVPFTPVDRTLVAGPSATPAAFCAGVVAPLLAGGMLLDPPLASHDDLPQAVVDRRPTVLVANAGDALTLLALTPDALGTAPSLKHVVVHGHLDDTTVARLRTHLSALSVGLSCV